MPSLIGGCQAGTRRVACVGTSGLRAIFFLSCSTSCSIPCSICVFYVLCLWLFYSYFLPLQLLSFLIILYFPITATALRCLSTDALNHPNFEIPTPKRVTAVIKTYIWIQGRSGRLYKLQGRTSFYGSLMRGILL